MSDRFGPYYNTSLVENLSTCQEIRQSTSAEKNIFAQPYPQRYVHILCRVECCVNFHLVNFYFGNTSKENSAIAIICTRIFSVSDNLVQPNYLSLVVKHDMMGLP